MGKMNLHEKAMLAVTTGAMNVNFVFWHEMFSSLGPKVPLVKREKS
jgi:hypothetical protein